MANFRKLELPTYPSMTGQPKPPGRLEEQFAPHYQAWKAQPSPETAGSLLGAVDPVIKEAMRTYGSNSASSPTLRGKARLIALNAIERYDPSRSKLRTHLLTQLQGLRRLAAREEQAIRVPEQMSLDRNRMSSSENELREQLGRDPSDAELADHAGISLRRIGHIRAMPGAFAEGSLTRYDEDGAGVWQPPVQQQTSDKVQQSMFKFVYHDLDPISQVIMEHTVGMHGKPVLENQQIAQKLRMSPGAVSQRKLKIQQQLDSLSSTGLFGG